ncbi:MAG TPA: hypothetical protein VMG09_06870 [Bacteroidota bacterium]|nr:hypothetical protein [Bacteroidota bacterium]
MLCDRPISRSEVVLNARVLGGIVMIDHGKGDDKLAPSAPDKVCIERVYDVNHSRRAVQRAHKN